MTHNKDFKQFLDWFDECHSIFVNGAIMGHDENYSPDVLRGRAQGLSILKNEMSKAGETVGRIQKIS